MRHSNATAHRQSRRTQAAARLPRQSGKLFALGPGKTGTHTLHALFAERGRFSCHWKCNGTLWPEQSTKRVEITAEVWQHWDAFSDRGEYVDFAWLDEVMPDARFLLNSRPLQPWLRSKLNHFERYHMSFSDDEILDWMLEIAQHQDRVLKYFNQSASRRARFALVDVDAMAGSDVKQIVDWILRRDSQSLLPNSLVLSAADLPLEGRNGVDKSAKLPVLFTHKKTEKPGLARIASLLEQARCPRENWHDSLYAACAERVRMYKERKH
jgi:hypothetical protein